MVVKKWRCPTFSPSLLGQPESLPWDWGCALSISVIPLNFLCPRHVPYRWLFQVVIQPTVSSRRTWCMESSIMVALACIDPPNRNIHNYLVWLYHIVVTIVVLPPPLSCQPHLYIVTPPLICAILPPPLLCQPHHRSISCRPRHPTVPSLPITPRVCCLLPCYPHHCRANQSPTQI
jgi:hypothetical protein